MKMERKEEKAAGWGGKKRDTEADQEMLHGGADPDADNGALSDSHHAFQFCADEDQEEDDEEQEEEEEDKGGQEEDQDQEEEHEEVEEVDERQDNEEEDEELAESARHHVPTRDEWSRATGLAAVLGHDSDLEDEEDDHEEDEADAQEKETEDEDADWSADGQDAGAIYEEDEDDQEDEDDEDKDEQEEEQPAQPENVRAKRGRRCKGNEYTAQQARKAVRRSHWESDRRVKRRRLEHEADQRAAINALADAIDSLGGFVPPTLTSSPGQLKITTWFH